MCWGFGEAKEKIETALENGAGGLDADIDAEAATAHVDELTAAGFESREKNEVGDGDGSAEAAMSVLVKDKRRHTTTAHRYIEERNTMSKRSTVITAALASILVLSGCAAPGTDLLPVVVDNPDDDLKPVEVGNPDDDLLPVKVGDPTDDLLPVESKNKQGKDCLPGTWLLSNASWKTLIDANAGAQGVTVEVPTGSVLLTFSDSATYSVEYAGWDIRMEAEDGTIQMHRQGKDSGSYSATASRVTLTESATGSSVTGSIQTSQGTIPLPAGMASQSSFVQSFSYTCKASALTATVPEGTLALSRN